MLQVVSDCTNALTKSPNVTSPVGLPKASISAWPSMMRVAFFMSTAERLDGHVTVESSHSDIDTEPLEARHEQADTRIVLKTTQTK